MRKIFYVFRHGETDANLAGVWQGQGVNKPLNNTGIKQAENLAEKMSGLGIEKIYSSPLLRAKQTAEAVAKRAGIQVEILPELTEGGLGDFEGVKKTDIAEQNPEFWAKWYDDVIDMSLRCPNGESKQEMQDRMFEGFEKMLQTPEKVIGVASHSGAMRYFFLAFNYGPHKMPNTALYKLIYDNGNWNLEFLG